VLTIAESSRTHHGREVLKGTNWGYFDLEGLNLWTQRNDQAAGFAEIRSGVKSVVEIDAVKAQEDAQ
jgi:hypothetical protein